MTRIHPLLRIRVVRLVCVSATSFLALACSSATNGDDGAGSGSSANGSGASDSGVGGSVNGATGGNSGAGGNSAGTGGNSGTGGSETAKATTCKRGIAYGHHSKADLTALSPSVAWWYNWTHRPDEALRDGSYGALPVEYVPMTWGASFDVAAVKDEIPAGTFALLGFNEPNFGEQSNLSASDAAAAWPNVEEVADARGLSLVSPAVNFCGGNCKETDPWKYLDDFFAACAGCRVDKIAFHLYVGCNANGENKAQWLINHVETYKTRFTQPLWLTEFACTDPKNEAEQIAFLKDAVAYLEAEPRIERYAWFSGRFAGMSFVDLLGADGTLTALGQAYVDADGADCQR